MGWKLEQGPTSWSYVARDVAIRSGDQKTANFHSNYGIYFTG